MDEVSERANTNITRNQHNDEFLRRLFARRPHMRERYKRLQTEAATTAEVMLEGAAGQESAGLLGPNTHEIVAETIVNEERPVLFVKNDWLDVENVTAIGEEAAELIQTLNAGRRILQPLMSLVGRIDVTNFPNSDFVGSGWLVDTNIVVTNRHVASLIARWDGREFAFSRGVGGRTINSTFHTLHEFDDFAVDRARVFEVKEVLYIERESGPDIAFLRVARRTDGTHLDHIKVAVGDIGENVPVVVLGYPARAPKRVIPDQELMKRLYRDRYDVKRAAPGLTMGPQRASARHDCTTLGGNSGSCIININTGEAVGLHFAGLYQEANFAVPASVLNEYVNRKRWNEPVVVETLPPSFAEPAKPKPPQPQASAGSMPAVVACQGGAVRITIPLLITVGLGELPPDSAFAPAVAAQAATAGGRGQGGASETDPRRAEAAVKAFWDERPEGVIAARLAFTDVDGEIADEMFIAASVPAEQIEAVAARGPAEFRGLAVRFLPANVTELIESRAVVESVDRISYDDDARSGTEFSFEPVNEPMLVRAHVGPEYSWDELKGFLDAASGRLVSAMYEFHGNHIKDAIAARLKDGVSLTMVLDDLTFTEVENEDEEFDRAAVFKRWKTQFKERFERVVAPERETGLISSAYHIKVTVRDDDTFWLSSGNWKMRSSQPIISEEERENSGEVDLRGNREWHVVVHSPTLAKRFRSHILQDFKRSRTLGGGDLPRRLEAADRLIDVAVEEAPIEERRPPVRILKPRIIQRGVRATPLLTPDREGAVYSEAVLELIRSARKSLLFQIPYIGMPSNPRADRGYIDELIKALTQKLAVLDEACVLLRAGGSRFAAPTHAAWYFKSKGVDIKERLRSIENHHTKGMIVDGRRVLIGSHNWSGAGVTLNRDASLIFDDEEIAAYFTEAFKIDWERANPINPKRFIRAEAVILEATGIAPPAGFRRMRLSELIKEDD